MENKDPAGAASPIGNKVAAKYFDAKYAPGIRTKRIDMELCKNDIPDKP